MRADLVVVPPPAFDQHPRFGEGVEDLTIKQLVAKRPVEALVGSIFRGGPGDLDSGIIKFRQMWNAALLQNFPAIPASYASSTVAPVWPRLKPRRTARSRCSGVP